MYGLSHNGDIYDWDAVDSLVRLARNLNTLRLVMVIYAAYTYMVTDFANLFAILKPIWCVDIWMLSVFANLTYTFRAIFVRTEAQTIDPLWRDYTYQWSQCLPAFHDRHSSMGYLSTIHDDQTYTVYVS